LREDLTEIGLSEAHVKLFHSLEELNHALILPTLEKLDNIRLQIEEEPGPFLLKDWVSKELHDLFWFSIVIRITYRRLGGIARPFFAGIIEASPDRLRRARINKISC
jgi:hypothetical protein